MFTFIVLVCKCHKRFCVRNNLICMFHPQQKNWSNYLYKYYYYILISITQLLVQLKSKIYGCCVVVFDLHMQEILWKTYGEREKEESTIKYLVLCVYVCKQSFFLYESSFIVFAVNCKNAISSREKKTTSNAKNWHIMFTKCSFILKENLVFAIEYTNILYYTILYDNYCV